MVPATITGIRLLTSSATGVVQKRWVKLARIEKSAKEASPPGRFISISGALRGRHQVGELAGHERTHRIVR